MPMTELRRKLAEYGVPDVVIDAVLTPMNDALTMLRNRLSMWEQTWPNLMNEHHKLVPETVKARVDELAVMIDNIEKPVPRCITLLKANGPRCINPAVRLVPTDEALYCVGPHVFPPIKAKPPDHSFIAANGERYTSLMDLLLQGDYLGAISQYSEDELRDAIERYTDAVCQRQADSDVNDEESELFAAVKLLDRVAEFPSKETPDSHLHAEVRKFLEEPHVKLLRSKIDRQHIKSLDRCHCGAYVVGTPGTKGHQRDRCLR